MAKEIVTRVWCDLCLGEDEDQEEATHRDNAITLGLGRGARPLTLDLCDRHYKELLEPLVEALNGYGVPAGDAPIVSRRARRVSAQATNTQEGPLACGIAGCVAVLKNVGSFNAHIRQQHGIHRADYVETYGEPVAVGPESFSDDLIGSSEARCEVEGCGKVYSHELGNNRPAQALGLHMWRKHDIRSERVASAS